ncbi:hypothetical protein B0H15DRAFT_947729 [Mycena belliarum]|uniref:Uncharacterized protein n=1 Tax=Mycena belliarum TaxID=1033014 RepID=A0AAD6UA09_9AGAR|nr:hypothetical protein B0H15DRAFT_947729 [Mycena belliae]
MASNTRKSRGRKTKMLPEQTVFLEGKFDDFDRKRRSGRLQGFWTKVENQWFRKWPEEAVLGIPLASPDEDAADGEPTISAADTLELGIATKTRKLQIHHWFNNRNQKLQKQSGLAKGSSASGNLAVKLFKDVRTRTRKLQAVEIYQKRHKDVIDESVKAALALLAAKNASSDSSGSSGDSSSSSSESDSSSSSSPDESGDDNMAASLNILTAGRFKAKRQGTSDKRAKALKKKRSDLLTMRRRIAQKMFDEEDQAERDAVNKLYRDQKGVGVACDELDTSSEDRTPEELQAAQDQLEGIVAEFHAGIERMTGFLGVTLLGGPVPSQGGRVQTKAYCSGETAAGLSLAQSIRDFDKIVVGATGEWLGRCFSKDVRRARALAPPTTNPEPAQPLPAPLPSAKGKDKAQRPPTKSKATRKNKPKAPALHPVPMLDDATLFSFNDPLPTGGSQWDETIDPVLQGGILPPDGVPPTSSDVDERENGMGQPPSTFTTALLDEYPPFIYNQDPPISPPHRPVSSLSPGTPFENGSSVSYIPPSWESTPPSPPVPPFVHTPLRVLPAASPSPFRAAAASAAAAASPASRASRSAPAASPSGAAPASAAATASPASRASRSAPAASPSGAAPASAAATASPASRASRSAPAASPSGAAPASAAATASPASRASRSAPAASPSGAAPASAAATASPASRASRSAPAASPSGAAAASAAATASLASRASRSAPAASPSGAAAASAAATASLASRASRSAPAASPSGAAAASAAANASPASPASRPVPAASPSAPASLTLPTHMAPAPALSQPPVVTGLSSTEGEGDGAEGSGDGEGGERGDEDEEGAKRGGGDAEGPQPKPGGRPTAAEKDAIERADMARSAVAAGEREAARVAEIAKKARYNPDGPHDLFITKGRKRGAEDAGLQLPDGEKRQRRPAASREMPVPLSLRAEQTNADRAAAVKDGALLKKLNGKRRRDDQATSEAGPSRKRSK